MSPFWILLELMVMEVVVTNVQCSSQNVTSNKPTPSIFHTLDALPVAQPTVSEHYREEAPQCV